MKKLLTILAITGTFAVIAEENVIDGINDEADIAEVAPAEAAPDAAATAALREEGTDKIDINEFDDSAEAAKNATVKADSENAKYVDIMCDDAALTDILRQFRKTTNANIISDDATNLYQRVSVNLVHVPWLQGLESILNMKGFRLDEREGIYRVVEDQQKIPTFTRTFQINHASPEELAKLFNKSYGIKDANGNVKGEVATAFPSANSVVVSATEKQLAECEQIIKAVDKAVAQIYIEARFMELSSDAMHTLGVKWDSLKRVGLTASNLRFDTVGGRDWSKSVNQESTSPWNLSRNVTDSLSKTLTKNFTGTLSATDFGLFMSAFENIGDTQVFSNPKVIVSNGKEAKIDMTTKYPNLTITSQRNNSGTTTYTDYSAKLEQIQGEKTDPDKGIEGGLFAGNAFFSWGIALSVKPRISPDGIISVEITPMISDLDKDISETGFYMVGGSSAGDENAAYGNYPILKVKSINTEFSMKDGSTAVIGGLSVTKEEEVDSGIPYLRKIPWIGPWLFGWKSREKAQKEIIICVTLGIANPEELPKDIGLPTNAVFGREFITGTRLEPGFRGGAEKAVLKLNTVPFHERKLKPGQIVIKASDEQ